MAKKSNIIACATKIAQALHSVSQIPVKHSVGTLTEALTRDMQWDATDFPSPREITLLVEGDDEGVTPKNLEIRFNNTCRALNSFF